MCTQYVLPYYSGGGPPFLQKITIKTKTKTSIYLHFFPFTIDHFPNSIQTCVTSHHKTGTYIYDLLVMEVSTYILYLSSDITRKNHFNWNWNVLSNVYYLAICSLLYYPIILMNVCPRSEFIVALST